MSRKQVAPGDILADLDVRQDNEELRGALNRALRSLDKAKATREELVAAVYRAARDAAAGMTIPPVPAATKDRRKGNPETAICLLADWQIGKTTPEYSSDIAAERVARYAEKAVRLIELQRAHHPVNEARIYLLGDLLEGEEIFPHQAHEIDSSVFEQAVVNFPRIAVRAILAALERTGGRRAEAAKLLDIGLRTLQRKLKDYKQQGLFGG